MFGASFWVGFRCKMKLGRVSMWAAFVFYARRKLIASNLMRFQSGRFSIETKENSIRHKHFRSDKWKCRPGVCAQLELFRNHQSRTLRSNFRHNRTPNVLNWPIIYSFEAILREKLSIYHNWMFRTQEEVWGLIFYWLFARLVSICVINQHRRYDESSFL